MRPLRKQKADEAETWILGRTRGGHLHRGHSHCAGDDVMENFALQVGLSLVLYLCLYGVIDKKLPLWRVIAIGLIVAGFQILAVRMWK